MSCDQPAIALSAPGSPEESADLPGSQPGSPEGIDRLAGVL